jgi:hypothetical protein
MIRFNTNLRNEVIDALTDYLTPSVLRCYSGNQPLSPNDTATGLVLVEFQITRGWNMANYGKAEIDRSTEIEGVCTSTGVIGWCRLHSDRGYTVDGTIGIDVVTSSTSVISGQVVYLTKLSFILPES